MVPRPDRSLVDRLVTIERRLRTMQQATAGATTANGGSPLANTLPAAVGAVPSAGGAVTGSRSDHVHTGTLAALADASVSAPAAGHELNYNGTAWANVPTVVSSPSAITNPYAGQLVYNTTDALLYKYSSTGSWVAVAALGPDSGTLPSSTQLHEARYYAVTSATPQSLSTGDNAIQFGVVDYASADVTASGTNNSVFTLNRGGLWSIDVNALIGETTATLLTRTLSLVSSDFSTIYKIMSIPMATTNTTSLSISCTMRFPSGTSLSGDAVSSATGSIVRSTASTASRTSLSLTWLRP